MKQKNENVFDPILKMYENQVKEADKSGDPEKLKRCADLFFKCVNAEMEDYPVTFEDIEYLDGYYIFGYGTNTIVHFHIKECPEYGGLYPTKSQERSTFLASCLLSTRKPSTNSSRADLTLKKQSMLIRTMKNRVAVCGTRLK